MIVWFTTVTYKKKVLFFFYQLYFWYLKSLLIIDVFLLKKNITCIICILVQNISKKQVQLIQKRIDPKKYYQITFRIFFSDRYLPCNVFSALVPTYKKKKRCVKLLMLKIVTLYQYLSTINKRGNTFKVIIFWTHVKQLNAVFKDSQPCVVTC